MSRILSAPSSPAARGLIGSIARGGLAPALLFAEANVEANAEAQIRGDALTNRSGDFIEIHEIRLTAFTPVQAAFNRVDCGAFVRVKLAFGEHKLTNSYVPIWLLGKTEQYPAQVPANPNANVEGRAIYVWRLRRPWFLSSKMPVTASFQHSGGIRYGVTAQITLAGRVVDKRPTTTAVPYAASFVSQSFGYSDVAYDESSESDLVNSLSRRVDIDRIAGRVATTLSTAAGAPTAMSDLGGAGGVRTTFLRLDGSRGVPIIRDYSLFRSVFGYQRSIDVPFYLDPNENLRCRVKNIAGPTLAVPYVTYYSQAHVAIVGSREETI